jgi:hypothetical protein
MKLVLIAILTALTMYCTYGQDSVTIYRQFCNDKPKSRVDSFMTCFPKIMFISLDEGFDDSLYITVNDTVVINRYLKTNESIDYADGFGIVFDKPTDVKILKLKFVRANIIIREQVNLHYKSLQIRGLRPWLLVYTNQFPMRQ